MIIINTNNFDYWDNEELFQYQSNNFSTNNFDYWDNEELFPAITNNQTASVVPGNKITITNKTTIVPSILNTNNLDYWANGEFISYGSNTLSTANFNYWSNGEVYPAVTSNQSLVILPPGNRISIGRGSGNRIFIIKP